MLQQQRARLLEALAILMHEHRDAQALDLQLHALTRGERLPLGEGVVDQLRRRVGVTPLHELLGALEDRVHEVRQRRRREGIPPQQLADGRGRGLMGHEHGGLPPVRVADRSGRDTDDAHRQEMRETRRHAQHHHLAAEHEQHEVVAVVGLADLGGHHVGRPFGAIDGLVGDRGPRGGGRAHEQREQQEDANERRATRTAGQGRAMQGIHGRHLLGIRFRWDRDARRHPAR